MPFTVDRSPHKQGLYLPGTRIPIRAPEAIARVQARLRVHPALEPAGRDHTADVRHSRVGRSLRRPDSRAHRVLMRFTPSELPDTVIVDIEGHVDDRGSLRGRSARRSLRPPGCRRGSSSPASHSTRGVALYAVCTTRRLPRPKESSCGVRAAPSTTSSSICGPRRPPLSDGSRSSSPRRTGARSIFLRGVPTVSRRLRTIRKCCT